MCLCHLIIFSFKGQAAACVLLFWVLEHRFTALLGGMDALLTMSWNFVCTGVATHRLHCQLLSLRDTAEAFMGHRMKLRSPLNEDSVQTVALYRSLLSSCVLIPGSVLRIFLKCSWTAHTHFSTVRQINKTDELFSPLTWPLSLAVSGAFLLALRHSSTGKDRLNPLLSDSSMAVQVLHKQKTNLLTFNRGL